MWYNREIYISQIQLDVHIYLNREVVPVTDLSSLETAKVVQATVATVIGATIPFGLMNAPCDDKSVVQNWDYHMYIIPSSKGVDKALIWYLFVVCWGTIKIYKYDLEYYWPNSSVECIAAAKTLTITVVSETEW